MQVLVFSSIKLVTWSEISDFLGPWFPGHLAILDYGITVLNKKDKNTSLSTYHDHSVENLGSRPEPS